MNKIGSLIVLMLAGMALAFAQQKFETDVIQTKKGDLRLTFIGHGTLMMEFGGMVIHVDPWGQLADYATLPKADLILITHHHGDHLDSGAVGRMRKAGTVILGTELVAKSLAGIDVVRNGDRREVGQLVIEAVPAYNLVHKRPNGQPFHPKGEGNGYVVTVGGVRVYIAGDTENTPEMKALTGIDVAFLPMNLPYTMTPEMVADAAKAFRPKILYPYHFGETDTNLLVELLKAEKGIEVRVRQMK